MGGQTIYEACLNAFTLTLIEWLIIGAFLVVMTAVTYGRKRYLKKQVRHLLIYKRTIEAMKEKYKDGC